MVSCYLNQKDIHIITCVTYMFSQRHGWYKQNEGLKERDDNISLAMHKG